MWSAVADHLGAGRSVNGDPSLRSTGAKLLALRENWMGWVVEQWESLAHLPEKSGIKATKKTIRDEEGVVEEIVEVCKFDGEGCIEDPPWGIA